MKKLLFIPVLLLFVACSTVKINYDYDRQADFSKYKTYTISDETTKMSLNQLDRDRIINAAKAEMATKGFSDSGTPDVILDIRVKGEEIQTATATTSGSPYGYRYRWGYGGGFATTTVNYDSYVEGTIFVTLVDKSTEKIIWQGTGKGTVDDKASTEKREANIKSVMNQIFSNYPPKAK